MIKNIIVFAFCLLVLQTPVWAFEPYKGALIDTHSAIDPTMKDFEIVIRLMEKAGVKKTILSANGPGMRKKHKRFVKKHPQQIVPAIKIMK